MKDAFVIACPIDFVRGLVIPGEVFLLLASCSLFPQLFASWELF